MLAGQVEHLSTGNEHFQAGGGRQQGTYQGRGRQDVLEVIQQQKRLLAAQIGLQSFFNGLSATLLDGEQLTINTEGF